MRGSRREGVKTLLEKPALIHTCTVKLLITDRFGPSGNQNYRSDLPHPGNFFLFRARVKSEFTRFAYLRSL